MTPEELLEGRHEIKLEWAEPWPACGPEGNDLDAHITISATVHDCVNTARLIAQSPRSQGQEPSGSCAPASSTSTGTSTLP